MPRTPLTWSPTCSANLIRGADAWETEYNLRVPRAASLILLVACALPVSIHAQRAVGKAARQPISSGFRGQRGFPNRFPRREFRPGRFRRPGGIGSYFVPYEEPLWYEYEQPDAEGETNEPIPLVATGRVPEPPIPKGQLIEFPQGTSPTATKLLPPTIFILANGERLEARRFVLTASLLAINSDRQRRTIPVDMRDINATLSANHERGIDLRIPDDRNEISLRF